MNIIITIIALIPLILSIIALVTSIKYVYTTIGLRNRDEYSKYVYIVKDMDRAMFRHALKLYLGYGFIRAMEINNILKARNNYLKARNNYLKAMERHKQRAVKRHKSSLFSNEVNRRKA